VCEAAPYFAEVNGNVLAQQGPWERVRLLLGDGRWSLRGLHELDVLTMEPLLPDSPYGVSLYTREFYAIARRALAADGLLCQWVPPHALAPEVFDAVLHAFEAAFPWSGAFLFGTQLVLLGGATEPRLDATRFPSEGEELFEALRALGIESPVGIAGRRIVRGSSPVEVPRPLTDDDPWILYRPRESGARRLLHLPLNLASLRSAENGLPESWTLQDSADWERRIEGLRQLRLARESFARMDAERRGLGLPADPEVPSLTAVRDRLLRELPDDAEAQAFERAVRLDQLRLGAVIALGAGQAKESMALLLDAIALAPERADQHLFLALALELLGESRGAQAARMRAFELCPRLLETPQGRRALELGLDPQSDQN
jgi:hypothetical protein